MREPRHKLNMLEPGAVLLKIMGALILAGAIARWLGFTVNSIVLFVLAGLLFAVLILLLIIEQRQDKRMYLEAKKEDKDIK
jgi:Flp pilus assembly protein TadB